MRVGFGDDGELSGSAVGPAYKLLICNGFTGPCGSTLYLVFWILSRCCWYSVSSGTYNNCTSSWSLLLLLLFLVDDFDLTGRSIPMSADG